MFNLSAVIASYLIGSLSFAVIAALVLYRHKSNIENLLQGKEGKIGDKAEN